MKHLIWLTPGFAADEADSKCIPPLQLLAKYLLERPDICLHIITLHYPYRRQVFQWNGIHVYPAYCSGPLSKVRIWRRAWSHLIRLLKKHPNASLHSFWLNDAALLGHWASRIYKRPHWVTLMGQDARPQNRYLRFFPLVQMKLITLSPFHDEQLLRSTRRRGDRIIPWGIDCLELQTPNSGHNSRQGYREFATLNNNDENNILRPIDVLGVGNLITLKDYASFVKIIAQLKQKKTSIKAVLIGDGVERPQLEQLAEQLGVAKQITFTGYLDRAEVLAYMQQANVFLHTSNYESFGYVFLEALACGMQVVSQQVGIAQAGSRWKIAPPEELATALEGALSDSDPREGINPYPIEKCLDQYLSLWLA